MLGYSYTSPLMIILTIIYFLAASITTLDIRLIQAQKFEGQDFGTLPAWTGIFHWLQWALFIVIAVLNWKYAIVLFIIKFILKVLPVLEIIGNILMSPFKPKKKDINSD